MKRLSLCSCAMKLVCYLALILGLCPVTGAAQSEILDSQRTVLNDDIVHYTFDVDLGPGEFDTIRLHRVVRERKPGHPVPTRDGIFMLPGAPNFFEPIFMEPLVSEVPAWDQSIAIFLAKHDIDVWGMDYAWAFVPLETTDFGFMQDWGLETDIDHAKQALSMVRYIRVATGQGNPRINILGFSYGVLVAYAIAGDETQLPPGQRLINGIISVDYDMKVLDETHRLFACDSAAYGQSLIDGGTFHDESGAFLMFVGELAKFVPGDTSPIFPPFTNWQAALLVGAVDATWWHFVGGEFDQYGIPTGLRFTDPQLMVDLFRTVPPYYPVRAGADLSTAICDEVDVPFDDYLGDITVPILAVGAAGGAAPIAYTPSLTASQDIESFTVQFLPDAARAYDFGHADLFTANDAKDVVWQPILEWLVDHRSARTYP